MWMSLCCISAAAFGRRSSLPLLCGVLSASVAPRLSRAFTPTHRPSAPRIARQATATSRDSGAKTEELSGFAGEVSESFRALVKKHKTNKAPKKMYEELVALSMQDALTSSMAAYAFRSFQRMERTDLALELIPLWRKCVGEDAEDVALALPMLKTCCKEGRMDLAEAIALAFDVSIGNSSSSGRSAASGALLPELAHGFASNKGFTECLDALALINALGLKVSGDASKHILKAFLRGESSRYIRRCLRYLVLASDQPADIDFIQILASNYLRSLEFIKGAVSIETLPPDQFPEVCFIGRSNVGKSSLINMLTNSKKLAFTSKTPGKTSEFNYFHAQGQVGPDKLRHEFFLVDVPGVGYAEVAKSKRRSWIDLLTDYSNTRPSLRLICHLVDSRHGLLAADEQCLALLRTIPDSVMYVLVLTKSDKRGADGRAYAVQEMKERLREYTGRDVPVILSSSETREGGMRIWAEMLDACAGEHITPMD